LSDFIQIPGKIVVYFPNKWGEETLGKIFMESFRSRSGQSIRSQVVVILWRERRVEEEKRRKAWPSWYRR
jgi:hypothetical protein